MGGRFNVEEHGNRSLSSAEFEKIVYIFGELRKIGILSDTEILNLEGREYGKAPILRILTLLKYFAIGLQLIRLWLNSLRHNC